MPVATVHTGRAARRAAVKRWAGSGAAHDPHLNDHARAVHLVAVLLADEAGEVAEHEIVTAWANPNIQAWAKTASAAVQR